MKKEIKTFLVIVIGIPLCGVLGAFLMAGAFSFLAWDISLVADMLNESRGWSRVLVIYRAWVVLCLRWLSIFLCAGPLFDLFVEKK